MIEVKFFMNGDESGDVHTMHFNKEWLYEAWLDDMRSSIEIISYKAS